MDEKNRSENGCGDKRNLLTKRPKANRYTLSKIDNVMKIISIVLKKRGRSKELKVINSAEESGPWKCGHKNLTSVFDVVLLVLCDFLKKKYNVYITIEFQV